MDRFRSKTKALIGHRVQIVNVSVKSYAPFNLFARFGVIENLRYNSCNILISVAIKISGTALSPAVLNPKSQKGLFWLPPEDVELIDTPKNNYTERNNIMKTYTVKLRHPSNGSITCALAFEEFVEGDTVVVDYHYGNGALSVRYVEDIAEYKLTHDLLLKDGIEIIGKVDRSRYDTAIDRRRKRTELMDKLRCRATACEEEYLWRVMAEYDPEMKTLLDELEALKK